MAKTSGLGDGFLVSGHDLSGDTSALRKISGPQALIDTTGINKSAHERLGGLRDGLIQWTSYWNSLGAHPVLSALPTSDILATYLRGTTLGAPAACCQGKQIGYDPTRSPKGELTMAVEVQANGDGLEWGVQLTPGIRTDTTATNGTAVDGVASSAFGFQAYLHVTALTGTNLIVKLQDSADNSTFADLSGGAFTSVTSAPGTQRLAVGGTATVRRYVRAVTSGTFTSASFCAVLVRNPVAVSF